MEMVNNIMQIYLNSFENQKMQIKVTMKYYFMPISVVKLREIKILSVSEDVWKLTISFITIYFLKFKLAKSNTMKIASFIFLLNPYLHMFKHS